MSQLSHRISRRTAATLAAAAVALSVTTNVVDAKAAQPSERASAQERVDRSCRAPASPA